MFLIKICNFFLLLLCIFGKLLPNEYAIEVAKQVEIYLKHTKPKNCYTTCNVFTLSDDRKCEDFWSVFLKKSTCAKYISRTTNVTHVKDTYSTLTVLVVKNQEAFKGQFELFIGSSYFMNKGSYKFAFCSPVTDDEWIMNTSKEIWNNRILNFVIIYCNVTLKLARYNPFKNKLQIFDATRKSKPEFPDALKDMQGYPLKILEIPRYVKFDIEYSYSFDTNFVQSLEKTMNLTITKALISKDESTLDNLFLRLSSEDIELVPFTETVGSDQIPKNYSQLVTYLNPYTMNNVVALVPNPKQVSQWHFFFSMLMIVVVPMTLSLSLLMASLDRYASWGRNTTKLDFMGFLALCLKSSLPHFAQQKSSVKVVWLLGCILNGIIYDIIALNFALVPRYEKEISCLSDLKSANLPIFSIDLAMPPAYNVTHLNKTAWRNQIQANRGNAAFFGAHETFDKIAKWHANTRRPYNYRLLKEVVVPTYGSFLIKAKSPYSYKLEQLVLRVRQFGAAVEVPYRYKPDQLTRESNKFLMFKDFLGIFAVWLAGMCTAGVILVMEIAYNAFQDPSKA